MRMDGRGRTQGTVRGINAGNYSVTWEMISAKRSQGGAVRARASRNVLANNHTRSMETIMGAVKKEQELK